MTMNGPVLHFNDRTGTRVRLAANELNAPLAAIYDEVEGTRKVYVANYDSGSISVINGGSVTNYTGIGGGPAGVALTPDGAYLYVALLDDDAVVVVRTSDNTVVKPITVGDSPWGVAVGSTAHTSMLPIAACRIQTGAIQSQ